MPIEYPKGYSPYPYPPPKKLAQVFVLEKNVEEVTSGIKRLILEQDLPKPLEDALFDLRTELMKP